MIDRTLSRHARVRIEQRAIPEFYLELLRLYGEELEQQGGSFVVTVPAKARDKLRRRLHDVIARWDHLKDVYAVLAADGTVVTVAHATRKRIYPKRSRRRTRQRGTIQSRIFVGRQQGSAEELRHGR